VGYCEDSKDGCWLFDGGAVGNMEGPDELGISLGIVDGRIDKLGAYDGLGLGRSK